MARVRSISQSLALRGLLISLALGAACRRAQPNPLTHGSAKAASGYVVTPKASAASPSRSMLEPSQAPDFGEADFPEVLPPIPPRAQDMEDHSDQSGWLSDGSEFGYCFLSSGSEGTLCEFFSPSGKRTAKVDDLNHTTWGRDPKRTPLVQQRIARYSLPRVRWPFARDLTLTWRGNAGNSDEHPDRVARLQVGARVRPAAPETFPISIVAGQWDFEIHIEAWAFSAEAKSLAVLSHSFAGEFADTFEVRVVATATLAEQAYNAAGLALHRRGDYAAAAPLFHKAAHADPSAQLPMYNLACALARLKDTSTEKALTLAIARGGREVCKKALKDADFDGVRSEPWFTALTR